MRFRSGARRGRSVLGLLLVVVALLAAACGDDDSDASGEEQATSTTAGATDTTSGEESPSSSAPAEAVAGCENGWTDPADLSPDREPARCEPGAPEPRPLDEPRTIKLALNNTNTEYVAVIVQALEEGEFERENLQVEFEIMPTADAYPLLADGTIDALWSGPNAGFVNAVQAGFEMKWVLSNYFPHDDSKTGLWINASDSESRDPVDLLAGLSGATVGSVTGSGSVLAYPLANALAEAELSIEDVRLEVLPFADIVVALQNGSIYAGWIVDPLWQQLVDDPDMVFAVAQPPAEPLGGLLYGPNLAEDREAGVALIRAIIRTMNTYFQGDYKSDPEFLSELATRLDQPEDVLGSTPPLIWDWEIRQDTIMRMQDAYIQDGSQESDPLPEDQLVDRSYYAEAVGHTE